MSKVLLYDDIGYEFTRCECQEHNGYWYQKYDDTKPDLDQFILRRFLIDTGISNKDLILHQSPLDARRQHQENNPC